MTALKSLSKGLLLIVTVLMQLSYDPVFAQQIKSSLVENISFTVLNGEVIVTYDLNGRKDQLYEVKLILRKENAVEFRYVPESVSGNTGKGYYAGAGNQILWNMMDDFPEGLHGEDFYFEVQVKETGDEINYFTWIGVGVAAAAAISAYILISGSSPDDDSDGTYSRFPPPPGRP
jgi:hypothetical protein